MRITPFGGATGGSLVGRFYMISSTGIRSLLHSSYGFEGIAMASITGRVRLLDPIASYNARGAPAGDPVFAAIIKSSR